MYFLIITTLDDEPIYPKNISPELKNLIKSLLNKDPCKRLGANRDASEIKEHQFFNNMDWKKLNEKSLKAPFIPKIIDPEQEIFPVSKNEEIYEENNITDLWENFDFP